MHTHTYIHTHVHVYNSENGEIMYNLYFYVDVELLTWSIVCSNTGMPES